MNHFLPRRCYNRFSVKFLDTSASRLPGLDLMRAIAILWVMLFHFRFSYVPSGLSHLARTGWMGVDLFFVLSGYLIGSQLLRPYLKDARPSLPDFYLRRSFRVLPAYLTVLAIYLTVPGFREAPGLSPAWQFLTFTENFRIDYFHDQAFSHVWSLCVEEHFYLVLPVLVLLIMRKPSFGKTLTVILSILVFGILIRWSIFRHLQPLLSASDNSAYFTTYIEKIYYPTYTRLDGLLMGVTLAIIKTFRPAWWQKLMASGYAALGLGFTCSAGAIWIFRDRFSLAGTVFGFPLMSLGMALIVAASISPRCVLSRIRGFAIPATLAYSLYLTHKEIGHLDQLLFGKFLSPSTPWLNFSIAFASSFFAAALLYLAVERPFLKWREKISASSRRTSGKTLATAGS
jgi:peptidoglycan/LPS O-acetylase OafA/YrhL